MLLVAELRLGADAAGLARVVAGGGDYVCEQFRLDYDIAPLIEAAALQALLAASGLGTGSLLDPDTRWHLRTLSALPADEQRDLLGRAVVLLDESPAAPRSSAARARSAAPPPASPAQQAVAPTSAITTRTPAPSR